MNLWAWGTGLALAAGLLIYWSYQRHVPVGGIPQLDLRAAAPELDEAVLLDLRDYRDSARMPADGGAIQLPLAYLGRHYGEIGRRRVVLVVSDRVLLNLGARFLRRKGIAVVGYSMITPGGLEGSCEPCV
ncbi:hypothetical protein IDH44_03315 [Paenibacillus sp. IB182496]|uniref:Rhodanese-like domain-containing protein n=1 Tax=Paenibacillus sabuli TaxID=2772509 RepID=A0A927BQR7_9BACL|nr:hypothetical protein [Paenibacillus sabuli]MBD2844206.1 hypothetical protein [Paenibacillus sabuli]